MYKIKKNRLNFSRDLREINIKPPFGGLCFVCNEFSSIKVLFFYYVSVFYDEVV